MATIPGDMSSQIPPIVGVDDSQTEVVKKQSGRGFPYEVSFTEVLEGKEEPASAAKSAAANAMGPETIDIPVDWEVTGDKWVSVDPSDDIYEYISSYSLHIAHLNPWFDWKLEFYNSQNKRFQFFDRTGDFYEVACGRRGRHDVKYNSDLPQIEFVRIWV
ncbi:hypothetical protein DL93DRAFT_1678972 [Clavulina sp. PMI_390]|nr:hypothetical protein DL93DRAFT_1678972 [Clavulina sp. PMI_390]